MKSFIAAIIILLLVVACSSGDSDDSTTQEEAPTIGAAPSETSLPSDDNTGAENNTTDDAPSEDIAALVNGEAISRTSLDAEVNRSFENSGAASIDTFRQVVLDGLIDQALIEQFATENGIVVEDDAVQAEIDLLQSEVEAAGFSLPALLGIAEDASPELIQQKVYESLLVQAVEQYVFENTPLETVQLRARHILVREESQARDVLARLDAGEDFAALAAELSNDRSTAEIGGDLGWIARGELLQPQVEAAIFSLEPGFRYPEPVQSQLGWHIIEVLDRDEELTLNETQIAQQRVQIFQSWLAQQRENADIQRFIS